MDAAAMAIAVGGGSSGPGSSSSSSASSSGYGSATTTPTTPLGAHYETSATIATVAPFYSEALTSLDAQQRQQQQHAQQQHAQQQHAQQQQQSHFYHQNYNYAGPAGVGVAGGGTMSLDAYNYSGYNYNAPRYEKLPSIKYNNNSSNSNGNNNSSSYASNINSSSNNTGSNSSSIYGSSSSNGNSNVSSNSSKPQAAATPFYAQPQSVSMSMPPMYMSNSNPYEAYKAYKPPPPSATAAAQQQYHSLGVGMGMGMGVAMNMNMNMQKPLQQQQQQQHHAQQQQQLHHHQQQQQQQSMQTTHQPHQQHLPQQQQLPPLEPSYAAIKPSSRYQNMAPSGGVYGGAGLAAAGGGVGVGVGGAGVGGAGAAPGYYDKYAMSLYPPNGGLSFGAPAPLYSPPELADSGYRGKSGNAAANCHWTATPNSSSTGYHHQAAGGPGAGGEMYYKYGGNPYQASMVAQQTPYGARGMWTTAPNPVENPPSARQSCCSQPYPQQSCYYPQRSVAPPAHPAQSVVQPPPPQYAVPAGNPGKLKPHPTDLYASYDQSQSQRSYMPQLGMAGGGGGAAGYGAMEANVSTAYYNDLGSLDAYGVVPPQQLQRAPTYQAGAGGSSMGSALDYPAYRKRLHPSAVAAPPSNNCYLAQGNGLAGLEADVHTYAGYDLHAPTMHHYAASSHKPAPAAASAHSSNIRDFLSSWNDDEEEQPLAVVAPTQVQPPPQVQSQSGSSFMYETVLPPVQGPVATAVLDAQVGELNLPDIIIDHHEKVVEDSFGSFDVEKELDELRLKKAHVEAQPVAESEALALEILREPPTKVQEVLPMQETSLPTLPLPALPQSAPLPLPPSLPETESRPEPQSQIEFDQSADNSNESTFEKEYETFIHKIGGSEEDEGDEDNPGALREHAKRFKFYKRKRRTTEQQQSNEISPSSDAVTATVASPSSSLPTDVAMLPPTPALSPKPAQSTRASRLRNRIRMLKILGYESPKSKHRFYFRTLKLLRRRFAQTQLRQQRVEHLRRQLALRKERRLPLIKRQSAKLYEHKGRQDNVEQRDKQQSKEELKQVEEKSMMKQELQQDKQREQVEQQEKELKKKRHQEEQMEQEQQQKQQQEQQLKKQQEQKQENQKPSLELVHPLQQHLPSSSSRETVIKSVYALREDQQERSEPVLDLQSGDSNHTLQSVELLGSFKGFDDVENTNLSPKAKLRVEPEEEPVPPPASSIEDEVKKSKQLEIQRWLHNNLEESNMGESNLEDCNMMLPAPPLAEPASAIICLSTSSSSSSSFSSSSSSSSDDSDSSDSSSNQEEQQQTQLKLQQHEQEKQQERREQPEQPPMSSSSSEQSESDSNELAALQKELSASKLPEFQAELTANTVESLDCDIAKLKQILESDGDEQEEKEKQKEKEEQDQPVPKLSDLSKNALNSSLIKSSSIRTPQEEAPQPRELSVEEALAEMYQQIGEDCEDRKDLETAAVAGQDVLLINLADIFDNNSSDLYVVQCDMNENILGVVAGEDREPSHEAHSELQLIELLADPIDQGLPLPEEEPEPETAFIHHEEVVVPEESKELLPDRARRQFLKYLHAKYVQCNISRFYHAQRVLKKYKRRRPRRPTIPARAQSQSSPYSSSSATSSSSSTLC